MTVEELFASAASLHILVAEDDADILEMLDLAFTGHGVRVSRARNGREALELLHHTRPLPNAILLDLRMRVMDGAQFLGVVQADPALAAIPVVVLTALSRAEQQATGLNVARWMSKPVHLRDLYAGVASVIQA